MDTTTARRSVLDRTRSPGAVVGVALAALVMTGCGGADEPTLEATPTPTATAAGPTGTPTGDDATTGPRPTPFVANTEEDTGEPAGPGQVALTDIEVTSHEGFERVTFHITGEGRAGWRVGYTDDPRSQGTGDPVDVAGGAVLSVVITNTGYPPDVEVTPLSVAPTLPDDLTAVRDLVSDSLFEGQHLLFVGVDRRAPFRVRRLDDPHRIVLEIITG